ncbi:hypothetical protein CEXT_115331, partial [Caerostris extrusa]
SHTRSALTSWCSRKRNLCLSNYLPKADWGPVFQPNYQPRYRPVREWRLIDGTIRFFTAAS